MAISSSNGVLNGGLPRFSGLEDTKCRHGMAPICVYLIGRYSPQPAGRRAKGALVMLFGQGQRQAAARTIARTPLGATLLGTAALLFCLATENPAYAASLNQDVNSPASSPVQFINPAAPQPIVPPPKATAARPRSSGPASPAKAASPPQTTAADTAAVVNKLLAPRQSDPNVPLPQENLAEVQVENAPLSGPRVYGRDESGNGIMGAILGLRIPIPADRGASSASSTSGVKSAP
jgi:hypothetical protein